MYKEIQPFSVIYSFTILLWWKLTLTINKIVPLGKFKFCKKERNDSLLNGLFDMSYFISPFDVIQEQTDMFLFFTETILFLIYLVLPLTDHE